MELNFLGGSLDTSLSAEMQQLFFEKMTPAVWLILAKPQRKPQPLLNKDFNSGTPFIAGVDQQICEKQKESSSGTAFCIDSKRRLLITCAHVVSNFVVQSDTEDSNAKKRCFKNIYVEARRDLDPDYEFVECKVLDVWEGIDLAILQVKYMPGFEELDHVTFDDGFEESRRLPLGMELFILGYFRSLALQLIRGVLPYEFNNDYIDYSRLQQRNTNNVVATRKRNNFYIDNLHGPDVKNSLVDDGEGYHPELKYLHVNVGGMDQIDGLSGSPIFNSRGKVVAILSTSTRGNIMGISATAMNCILSSVRDVIDKKKKKNEYKRMRKKQKRSEEKKRKRFEDSLENRKESTKKRLKLSTKRTRRKCN